MSRNSIVGGYGLSAGALKMDNFTGVENITGQKDYFVSPRIDFSNALDVTYLTFDVAYARRNGSSTDNLQVSVSTDCGISWGSVYSKSGSVLSTAADVAFAYTPLAEEWRTDSIDMGAYKNFPEVMLMFSTNSNHGNNLYLDNINITSYSTVGIKKNVVLNQIKIYPNPSSGSIKIDGMNQTVNFTEIKVTNIIGQELKHVSTKEAEMVLDLSEYVSGTYFITINNGDESIVRKVVLANE